MTMIINYGVLLQAEIKAKGYSKMKIAEILKINARTLDARLKDGEFTIQQLNLLQENRYLPID